MSPHLVSRAVAALLSFSMSVAAQPSGAPASVSTRASAEALFEEGVRLTEQNRLEEACEKFEASEALDVAVGTLLRLADCRERTGRYATAWARFREAGSLAETQGMAERARIAAVRSAALEPKLARVVLLVPPAPPAGYTVRLGDITVPSASWGSSLPLDAGTVRIEASAPGFVPYHRYLEVPAGPGTRLKVSLPPLEPRRDDLAPVSETVTPAPRPARARVPAAREPAGDEGYAARVIGLSLAAAGGLGLGTGGVLALIGRERAKDAREFCSGKPRECTPRGAQLDKEADRLTTYAAVSGAIGGGLVVAGLIIYLTAPSERKREQVALGVAPDGRGGFSLQASGAF
jgi:hypothetical protein